MKSRVLVGLLALLLAQGCGQEATNDDANAQIAEAGCEDGQFDTLVPLAPPEPIPFRFEHPEGWTNFDVSNDFTVAGAISDRYRNNAPGYVEIKWTVRRDPVPSRDDALQQFESQSFVLLRTVDFGDGSLDVYHLPEDAPAGDLLVGIRFLVPDGEDWFWAEASFDAPEDECWEERLALRDAFVDSLAPPQ